MIVYFTRTLNTDSRSVK